MSRFCLKLLLKLLLRAYPRRHRREFGSEISEMLAIGLREEERRSRLAAFRFVLRNVVDMLRSALALRGEGILSGFGSDPAVRPFGKGGDPGQAMIRSLALDIRSAVRSLARAPVFSLATILLLALGLGANAAMFSLVNGVLLRPLPYADSERLVALKDVKLPQFAQGIEVSPGHFVQWRERNTVFEDVGAYVRTSFNLAGPDLPERVAAVRLSAGLLSMLGMAPMHGRLFRPEEDQPGQDDVVIISHGHWQRRFAGDPATLGKRITLDGRSFGVIGILGPGFEFPGPGVDLWIPLALSAQERQSHGNHYLSVVARLKPEVTMDRAQSEMREIARQLETEHPKRNVGWSVRVEGQLESSIGDSKPTLLLLQAAVGLVLLIVCANLASMLLSRSASRRSELAIRASMGASGWRLARQLLVESILLSLSGACAGLLLAVWCLGLVPTAAPDLPRLHEVGLDGSVVSLTFGLALLAGLLFGLAPALQAVGLEPSGALQERGRGSSTGPGRERLRRAIVVAEVAMALVLLIGAGLLTRSLGKLRLVDPGFRPQSVHLIDLDLPKLKYPELRQVTAFFKRLIENAAALPGVEAAGVARSLPFVRDQLLGLVIEGRPPAAPGETPSVNYYPVSHGYFEAMGIPLAKGRLFTELDRQGSPRVVIVNETMARRYFPGQDPVGKRIHLTNGPEAFREIVGVAGDVLQYGLDQAPPAQVYEPFDQQLYGDWDMTLVVRSSAQPAELRKAIQNELRKLDQDQPLSHVRTLQAAVSGWMSNRRAPTQVVTLFAAAALLLAVVGIYAVLTYSVAQRTREIGIRMALGARAGDVFVLVVSEGMALALIGMALGAAAAYVVTQAMRDLLFDVAATDPATFTLVPLLLLAAVLLAGSVPARRAARLDPLAALRSE